MYDVWSERLEDLERAYLGGAGPAVGYNNTAAGVERKEVAESSAPPPPPFPSPEPAQEQEQDTHALLPRPPASNRVHPHRLVGLAEALDSPRVERLRAAIERQAGYTVELLVVSPSVCIVWEDVLLSVCTCDVRWRYVCPACICVVHEFCSFYSVHYSVCPGCH